MIVPMKKVSLIIRENKKDETLKKLRKIGIVNIEIAEGAGERLASLQEQIALLESAIFTIGKRKNVAGTYYLEIRSKFVGSSKESKILKTGRFSKPLTIAGT